MNLYFIKGSDVIDSILETIDSSLNQTEIDKLLALSEREQTSGPKCLHFMIHGENVILEKKTDLTSERLFHSSLPPESQHEWPQTIRGIPCSPGIVIAPCVHLHEFKPDEVRGKILITSFLNIKTMTGLEDLKGIILEKGSLLSHVGVLTREKHIPCIVGVKDAQSIPDGSVIKMDAFTGLITPTP